MDLAKGLIYRHSECNRLNSNNLEFNNSNTVYLHLILKAVYLSTQSILNLKYHSTGTLMVILKI